MKIQLTFVILSLLAAQFVVKSQDSYVQVYCGRRLASALSVLCDDMNLVKRSQRVMEFEWPWVAGRHTSSLAGGRHRGKRQVVSECCDKPCTIDELLSYC